MAPAIQTYHCICSSLLLASTHTLSALPRRTAPSLDAALILPVSEDLPELGGEDEVGGEEEAASTDLPAEGYTKLLGMVQDRKTTIIRREDGFEKRALWRCVRCDVAVGYEILSADGTAPDAAAEGYTGKVVCLFPGGIMSTEAMVKAGKEESKIKAEDIGIGKGVVAAWE